MIKFMIGFKRKFIKRLIKKIIMIIMKLKFLKRKNKKVINLKVLQNNNNFTDQYQWMRVIKLYNHRNKKQKN